MSYSNYSNSSFEDKAIKWAALCLFALSAYLAFDSLDKKYQITDKVKENLYQMSGLSALEKALGPR